MNKKAEFAVKLLKQYALENQVPARSTSDLSKLEEWLIVHMLNVYEDAEALIGQINEYPLHPIVDNQKYVKIVRKILNLAI
jgi:hypothetical protein